MSSVAPSTDSFDAEAKPAKDLSLVQVLDQLLKPLASQKIAVAMFAYGIFVVLVGTLAQVDKDIWQVVPEYFRAWIMFVDINVFFPPSFFPSWKRIEMPPIPMPGGMVVGVTMILNMLFAHTRWVLQLKTKMSQAIGGIGLIAFGWLVTLLVILAGHNSGGFQQKPPFTWDQFWMGMQVSLIGIWVTSVFSYFWYALQPMFRVPNVTMLRAVLVGVFGVALAALSIGTWFVLFKMDNPGAEGLRIVWQLLKGTFAGVILLPGCWLLFQKRGGVVLLHQGMLLLMMNELFVARYAVEYNMSLTEGQTSNYLRDIRATEVALIDRSGKEKDEQFVVPFNMLLENGKQNEAAIKDGVVDASKLKPLADPKDLLPVQVTVLKYFRNADLRKVKADEKTPATKGVGLKQAVIERPSAKGTDTDSSVDLGAAYVQFKDKKSGADLGTYLLSQTITEQDDPSAFETVEVSGKPYLAALRFKRQFVPFTVQLKDVRKDDYVASNTPRNYSSDVLLKDPSNGVESTVHIKMNDPLRYSGLTIYQSGYQMLPGGVEHTTLAVVQNVGWMIPYVALMIITVGMIAHFLSTLTRFLRRRENEEIASGDIIVAEVPQPQTTQLANQPRKGKKQFEVKPMLQRKAQSTNWNGTLIGIAASTIIFALFVGMAVRKKSPKIPQLDYESFGQLPVAGNGRVMPFDSLVRNTLLQLRQRETAKTKDGVTIPATQWFLDLITGSAGAASHRVFKIDNPEVQKVFELDLKRYGHTYSTAELFPQIQEFEKQVRAARVLQKESKDLSLTQRKLLHMDGQLSQYMVLVRAFNPPQLPPLPDPSDDPQVVQQKILAFKQAMMESSEMLEQAKPPLAIPLPDASKGTKSDETPVKWQSFHNAWIIWFLQTNVQNQPGDPATDGFINIVRAYRAHAGPRDEWIAAKQELADLKSKKAVAARIKRLQDDVSLLKKSTERQRGVAEEIVLIEKEIKDLDDSAYVAKRQKELPEIIAKTEKEQTATIEPFNLAVTRYAAAVERTKPPEYNRYKLDLESWMNRVSPFYVGMQLYIVAFLLATFGWLIPSRSCNWAAFTMVFLTFALHTFALVLRIYISGRPPVTNLYSSAVFIGWFCVLVGMVIELVFRIGLGNLVSTIAGFATLIIAYFLSMSGDTIGVMQAVLDTQFWLATHVVCITIGYGATFFAGFLGVLFVVLGIATPGLNADFRKMCARMIYGVVCFAMFFSFIGTVLGGLWADDSWGRFWGWDPKENGALIIVLWNALILHAKWDKMVADRGLALLAIGGNIVTAWSWFGVNELGVGLHSYGFTEGVLFTLLVFVGSQLALITLGAALPMNLWWSVRDEQQKFRSVLLDNPLKV